MEFFDTHCHIHSSDLREEVEQGTQSRWAKGGNPNPFTMVEEARAVGVEKFICVGCNLEDSRKAISFVSHVDTAWVSIGIHPHEAKEYVGQAGTLKEFVKLVDSPKVVAVGECGLDYYYNHSVKDAQQAILKFQLDLAKQHNLPVIFHVRDAFSDFWPIFDQYPGLRGVIHSFSSTKDDLKDILARKGLYVGLNGIMTFTKRQDQLEAAKAVPLSRLLLETDAPFLTPVPYRGTICQLKHVRTTAEFLAELRGENLQDLAEVTTANAHTLFQV